MKKVFLLLAVMLMIIGLVAPAAVAAPPPADKDGCYTIQGGSVKDSLGNTLTVGFDQFGYNYQAHIFVGTYDSSDRVLDGKYWGGTGDYVDDMLIMQWSNEWLANVDCNGDHLLDRGLGTTGQFGVSQGWLTNHVTTVGDEPHTVYFAKIVYVGAGGSLWGVYDVILEVWNDPANGDTGLSFKVGAPGFGLNDHWTD